MVNLVKEKIETLGFHQMVTGDTRFWRDTKSLIDQCWTDCPQRLLQSKNEIRASSDHNLIQFLIRISGSNNKPKEAIFRDKSNMNLDRFKSNIANIDWSELLNTQDLNIAYNIFESEMRKYLDMEAPIISRVIKIKNKKWISKNTKDQMKLRDHARDKASTTQLETDWQLYKSLRNSCSKMTRTDKNEYYRKLFNEHEDGHNISKLYQKVKHQIGWTTNGPPQTLVIDGKPTSSSKKMADNLMQYFYTKVKNLTDNVPTSNTSSTSTLREALHRWGNRKTDRETFHFRPITQIETVQLISSLGNSSSFSADELDSITLKLVAPSILSNSDYFLTQITF